MIIRVRQVTTSMNTIRPRQRPKSGSTLADEPFGQCRYLLLSCRHEPLRNYAFMTPDRDRHWTITGLTVPSGICG
ncbi:hypothetical protein TGAM01_v204611 [Trichoderma gamsii]|uniref:Uncharacterized protein n=1 Tax=Trichoderma gamsii TaxID=398673 RepID=A0A2P4ZQQ6_9HYPO|nr:hypothetical protein TGAM01_v204611 [Trichoderma gamsii]PON26601.1 hypothetical protein TGAM01_v204611 [Trichoderma gamsii]